MWTLRSDQSMQYQPEIYLHFEIWGLNDFIFIFNCLPTSFHRLSAFRFLAFVFVFILFYQLLFTFLWSWSNNHNQAKKTHCPKVAQFPAPAAFNFYFSARTPHTCHFWFRWPTPTAMVSLFWGPPISSLAVFDFISSSRTHFCSFSYGFDRPHFLCALVFVTHTAASITTQMATSLPFDLNRSHYVVPGRGPEWCAARVERLWSGHHSGKQKILLRVSQWVYFFV